MTNEQRFLMNATEQQLRDYKVPWVKTLSRLNRIIDALSKRKHDYGTCVYAMSITAVATFYYVSNKINPSGFQASCADMDILSRTRGFKFGSLQDYSKLLYPQYCDEEHFPTWKDIIHKNAKWYKNEAIKLLSDRDDPHPNVKRHWIMLSKLKGVDNAN